MRQFLDCASSQNKKTESPSIMATRLSHIGSVAIAP